MKKLFILSFIATVILYSCSKDEVDSPNLTNQIDESYYPESSENALELVNNFLQSNNQSSKSFGNGDYLSLDLANWLIEASSNFQRKENLNMMQKEIIVYQKEFSIVQDLNQVDNSVLLEEYKSFMNEIEQYEASNSMFAKAIDYQLESISSDKIKYNIHVVYSDGEEYEIAQTKSSTTSTPDAANIYTIFINAFEGTDPSYWFSNVDILTHDVLPPYSIIPYSLYIGPWDLTTSLLNQYYPTTRDEVHAQIDDYFSNTTVERGLIECQIGWTVIVDQQTQESNGVHKIDQITAGVRNHM